MSVKMGIAARVALVTALALADAGMTRAQESTAPLFSTPASRSTTGAPILNDPSKQNGELIDNTGGGRQAPSVSPTSKQAPQSATAAVPQGDGKTKEWSVQCAEVTKVKRCQVLGAVLSPDKKQVIMVMSLAAVDDKSTATQIAVPLGIALKPGVKIDVSGAYTATMAVSRCTSQGCLIETNVDSALLDAMKTKPAATVTVTTPDGKSVPIKLLLDGFPEAFAAMKAADHGGK
ncbi:invasion protein IalB [Rhizobium sp. BK313]|jgi:invasion protein IalB|uniref:invasion associated locus B family protein n=1 Tax=Rhizobium sp. BK313 TaxID=2587081 RepID=UPI0010D39486|nr:invasion associated locus B family protein [Rhizobium sp. BK313]MBB3458619.1 invasion protein IalB [Rhizobium sp. BK313]